MSGEPLIEPLGWSEPPEMLWAEDQPVLAHFSSLGSASEFCAAADLELNVAPYDAPITVVKRPKQYPVDTCQPMDEEDERALALELLAKHRPAIDDATIRRCNEPT